MHRKLAKDGLVVITVSVDEPPDKEAQANCLKFLKAQKASFTNLILDEKPDLWQEKLGFFGPPYFFVFNREGKYQRFDASQVGDNLENVEKKAIEWLKQK